MTLPAIPVAPGTRGTVVATRPLYFNRYAGHASARQAERQALGADVAVTLTLPARHPASTTGTLDGDGHIGVATGLLVALIGASWEIVDAAIPAGTSDTALGARLVMLGYMPIVYCGARGLPTIAAGFNRIMQRMIYDFQADHGIVATGELDDETRNEIVDVFGE